MMISLSSFKAAAKSLAPSTPEKALFLGASTALVVGGVKRSRAIEQLSKPLVLTAVGIGLWRTRDQRDRVDNILLGKAAIASLVGDQLMLEEEFAADSESADKWIKRGASAFAVNHAAIVSVARRHGAKPGAAEFVPRLAGLAEGLAVLATRRRHMLVPLGGYSKLLALMSSVMAAPQLTEGTDESDPRRALELGGMLFLVSDATILHRKVFLDKDSAAAAAAEGWVLASYCAAQALLFSGLAKLSASQAG